MEPNSNLWKLMNKHWFDKDRPTIIRWKKGLLADLEILKYRIKTDQDWFDKDRPTIPVVVCSVFLFFPRPFF